MQSLPPAIHGLILDHLVFRDVLRATITDRAARKTLGAIHQISRIRSRVLTMPDLVSNLGRCESITILANSAGVMERLAWALKALSNLRCVRIIFIPGQGGINNQEWNQSCKTLSRTMVDVTRIESFHIGWDCAGYPGGNTFRKYHSAPLALEDPAFHGVLFRLPLDCALATATDGPVPYHVVEMLIDRGANVNSMFHSSLGFPQSILSQACSTQRSSVINLLLVQGARDSRLEKFDCFVSALARRRDVLADPFGNNVLDVLRLLYGAGLRSWYRDECQGGLLHLAICYSDIWDLEYLLEEIFELVTYIQPELATLSDGNGRTPLSYLLEKHPITDQIHDVKKLAIARKLYECERVQREI